ncbi:MULTISPECIES: site-2 protease family protein [Paenibacillus]|uniref:Peptidase M50-like protein n=1 Tax=Paenibacillus pabuli TaxID=1472 RepID=A0A855YBX9_9BACL|nr:MULTISPECIES: site-2 protease family protein [Paenibacillus]PWW42191.1 peptidase M50-like protein [Paenibacillus pabuli]PXW07579.1 peptidase M50-like protein [Paenibacillus taichungensis]RAI94658.1 peptidase M50-like protein [Paenibacillus pabuli]
MKKNLVVFVGVTIVFALATSFLLGDTEGIPTLGGWGGVSLLTLLLNIAIALVIAIMLHEFGHILGALFMGNRVTHLIFGPFLFSFSPFHLEWKWKQAYFFGAMKAEVAAYEDERTFAFAIRSQRVIYSAGPAFSLLLGLLTLNLSSNWLSLWGLFGFFSAAIGIGTLFTDGTNALLLGRRNYYLFFAWTALITASAMDVRKLDFLLKESRRYLYEVAARNDTNWSKDLYNLNVLYFYTAMQSDRNHEDTLIARLTGMLIECWREVKTTCIHQNTVAMILAEEVIRLKEVGQHREADNLLHLLLKKEALGPLSSLKVEAFTHYSDEGADSYLSHIQSMYSPLHPYGALLGFEEQRLKSLKRTLDF